MIQSGFNLKKDYDIMTNENTYTAAVNLENLESGLITLHQATFRCANRWEAIGRAVEKFMEIGGGAIHSYKINLVVEGMAKNSSETAGEE